MSLDLALVWTIGLTLAALAMWPYLRRQRRLERAAAAAAEQAHHYGLHEPASLHPIVNPARCIGTGNCVEVCPEKDVLGLYGGQAHPVSPARCVGHGLCERACPVEAIQLVFGTEQRGVELPRVRENFETNVPGLYVIGELGGMGLIRNAFRQGQQCIAGIAKAPRDAAGGPLDVLIVGCGPAGLAASLACLQHGLRFATIEKEGVGGAVRSYPRKKIVMTAPLEVPGYGRLGAREMPKEDLVRLWDDVIGRAGLTVQTGETVTAVTPEAEAGFSVVTDRGAYAARRVVLAIGRRGVPRKLGIAGESLPHVAYALREPEAYAGDRIVVVGGGDAAVEAALALAGQPGTSVALSYRGQAFSRIKPGNHARLEAAAAAGQVEVLWGTQLTEILPGAVCYHDAHARVHTRPADAVFIFAGGTLPTAFLRSCGVAIDTKFGTP